MGLQQAGVGLLERLLDPVVVTLVGYNRYLEFHSGEERVFGVEHAGELNARGFLEPKAGGAFDEGLYFAARKLIRAGVLGVEFASVSGHATALPELQYLPRVAPVCLGFLPPLYKTLFGDCMWCVFIQVADGDGCWSIGMTGLAARVCLRGEMRRCDGRGRWLTKGSE